MGCARGLALVLPLVAAVMWLCLRGWVHRTGRSSSSQHLQSGEFEGIKCLEVVEVPHPEGTPDGASAGTATN